MPHDSQHNPQLMATRYSIIFQLARAQITDQDRICSILHRRIILNLRYLNKIAELSQPIWVSTQICIS
jgi:hypothetical protein